MYNTKRKIKYGLLVDKLDQITPKNAKPCFELATNWTRYVSCKYYFLRLNYKFLKLYVFHGVLLWSVF